MKRGRIALVGVSILMVSVLASVILLTGTEATDAADPTADALPAAVMSVAVVRAQSSHLPIRVPASGNVAAWQEASIGAEGDGLRLIEVKVHVGDTVRRGQALAVFDADIVAAELAESAAAVAQAEAEATEAEANHQRARDLDRSGAMSAQEVGAYALAAKSARARLEAMRATEQRSRLRLAQTRVHAPSDGIISARSATVGAVIPAGQELFRLIEDGRLEWRADVAAADLDRLRAGQVARLAVQGQASIRGELRIVAPTIDSDTLSGLAYVDLPAGSPIRAGAFVRGHIEIGEAPALTLPDTAVLLRDGFHYVLRVEPESVVRAARVSVGRRVDDRIEIIDGLSPTDTVVAAGLSFLGDGDTVRVVDVPEPALVQQISDLVPAAAASGSRP